MKSSEVAKAVDLPISTIRYYEKIGIITEDYILRDQNNYRNYADEVVPYIEVVKTCLAVGFSIHDIKSMISLNGISKEELTRIISNKVAEIDNAQQKLEKAKQDLYEILESDVICEEGFGKYG